MLLKKTKLELPYNLVIPLLGIYPDKTIIQRYMHPNSPQRHLQWSPHGSSLNGHWWTNRWRWWWCRVLSHWLFVTPWTVAHQAPLSMEFSRQEYWSGLPFPSPMINHYIFLKGILDRLHKRYFFFKKAFIDLIAPRSGSTLQLRNKISFRTRSCKETLTSNPTFLRFAFFMALFFKTSSLATENVPTCRSVQIKQQ